MSRPQRRMHCIVEVTNCAALVGHYVGASSYIRQSTITDSLAMPLHRIGTACWI